MTPADRRLRDRAQPARRARPAPAAVVPAAGAPPRTGRRRRRPRRRLERPRRCRGARGRARAAAPGRSPAWSTAARQLRVVGPRAAVEVVGADRGPLVVDDADLGVHVDRGAGVVLQAVERRPGPPPRLAQRAQRPLAAEQVRRRWTCGRPGPGRAGAPRSAAGPGWSRSAAANALGDRPGPQVLVLEVDQRAGPGRAPWRSPRATLRSPCGRERVAAPRGRVGAQQLDADARRSAPGRAAAGGSGSPAGLVLAADRSAARRTGLRVSGCGSSHRSRKVVSTSPTAGPVTASWTSCQGGRWPYTVGHRLGLRVAAVLGVVAAAVAEVDAADEGDVQLGPARVAQDDELLVVRAAEPDPHVQQRTRRRPR